MRKHGLPKLTQGVPKITAIRRLELLLYLSLGANLLALVLIATCLFALKGL